MSRRREWRDLTALVLLAPLLTPGCGPSPAAPVAPRQSAADPRLVEIASPAGRGAMAPWLTADGDDLLLSWLEPTAGGGWRLLFARLGDGAWTAPREIAAGDDFFANWADVPKIGVAGDGTLWAHWLAKVSDDTYAYSIFLARSADGGVTWEPRGTLNDDATPSEHGFVAYAVEGDGLRAVWLDGREMPGGGPMTLRTAWLGTEVGPSTVLDERVCECCPTDLVATTAGALAPYRDRSPSDIRNIAFIRRVDGVWSAPRAVYDDDWRISGCPVNGPAAAVASDRVALAWFTARDGRPRVQLAISDDAGATFGPPRVVDEDQPLGRVDVEFDATGAAWVTWLTVTGAEAQLRAARFATTGPGEAIVLASTAASRASGIPRLARAGQALVAAWVETELDQPATIRLARLP